MTCNHGLTCGAKTGAYSQLSVFHVLSHFASHIAFLFVYFHYDDVRCLMPGIILPLEILLFHLSDYVMLAHAQLFELASNISHLSEEMSVTRFFHRLILVVMVFFIHLSL